MPVFVKSHRRGRSIVKAYARKGLRFSKRYTHAGNLELVAHKGREEVGHIRLARRKRGTHSVEISNMRVSNDHRGKGIATDMYKMLRHKLPKNVSVVRKSDNILSGAIHRIYSKLGSGRKIRRAR